MKTTLSLEGDRDLDILGGVPSETLYGSGELICRSWSSNSFVKRLRDGINSASGAVGISSGDEEIL